MSELDVLYESVQDRITIDKETFKKNLKDWQTTGLYEDGDLIGCVIQKDNEVHIGYKKQPKNMRKHLKQTLKKVLDDFGYAITYVAENNEKGLNFCKRLGFYEIVREKGKITLICDRCKYV